jgi:excisionase family DNA binding protein
MKIIYRIKEAAAELGVSRSHLYALIARGRLRKVRIGRCSFITGEEIRDFVWRETGDPQGWAQVHDEPETRTRLKR